MLPTIPATRHLVWTSEVDCAAFAAALATRDGIADAVIELHGPLGAGKTTFARHLLRALGVGGRIKSPSYALMEAYTPAGGGRALHFDFYRFADAREWIDAGLRDAYAEPGLKIAEWPERAAGLLPPPDLRITITIADDDRRLVDVEAPSARGRALIE